MKLETSFVKINVFRQDDPNHFVMQAHLFLQITFWVVFLDPCTLNKVLHTKFSLHGWLESCNLVCFYMVFSTEMFITHGSCLKVYSPFVFSDAWPKGWLSWIVFCNFHKCRETFCLCKPLVLSPEAIKLQWMK
jgi:hypothetical protein